TCAVWSAGRNGRRSDLGLHPRHDRPRRAPSPTAAGPLGHRALAVRKESKLSCRLDGHGDVALVLGTVTAPPPGPDLAAVAPDLPEQVHVLVVDPVDLVLA